MGAQASNAGALRVTLMTRAKPPAGPSCKKTICPFIADRRLLDLLAELTARPRNPITFERDRFNDAAATEKYPLPHVASQRGQMSRQSA